VHSVLREVIRDAYSDLSKERPGVQFVYGEMAWPRGGNFWPHKSHQNGLCADFFVPVVQEGRSIPIPTRPWNKFGYGLEFDSHGRMGDLVIDYDAMASHVLALNRRASERGLAIAFVILDNQLQGELAKTPTGRLALASVRFSRLPSWVRHDEHYHIEFIERRGTAYN
jgi:penicillin-insensitive murein endopeptidase